MYHEIRNYCLRIFFQASSTSCQGQKVGVFQMLNIHVFEYAVSGPPRHMFWCRDGKENRQTSQRNARVNFEGFEPSSLLL